MSYKVVGGEGVVRVGESGQLVSGPTTGSAVVHVSAREEFGLNQTLVFLVKVTSFCILFHCALVVCVLE